MTDKKYCIRCQGAGQVDTGIMESPVTICNDCNGTGLAKQRTWVGLTDEEVIRIRDDMTLDIRSHLDFYRHCEAKLKEKNT